MRNSSRRVPSLPLFDLLTCRNQRRTDGASDSLPVRSDRGFRPLTDDIAGFLPGVALRCLRILDQDHIWRPNFPRLFPREGQGLRGACLVNPTLDPTPAASARSDTHSPSKWLNRRKLQASSYCSHPDFARRGSPFAFPLDLRFAPAPPAPARSLPG